MTSLSRPTPSLRILLGFAAGFLSVLIFHQPALALLNAAGITSANLYSMQPTRPLAIPQILSTSFWGGIWGVLFALLQRRLHSGPGYWLGAFAFGAVLPTLIAWFVVAPLRGMPVAAGWQPSRMLIGPLINGVWGVGTALIVAVLAGVQRLRR